MPILLHDDCFSLLSCMQNDLRLEVYPCSAGKASGSLYLDDGASFEFTDRESKSARLNFQYSDNTMDVSFEHGDKYEIIPNVVSVAIYGVNAAPKSVTTADGSQELSIVQDLANESLFVLLPAGTKASEVSIKVDF